MKLFDVIPADYFRLLTGKNREIYVEALLVLHVVFKQSMHIERDEFLTRLTERLAELNLYLETDEDEPLPEQDADLAEETRTWSSMAHFILRRLTKTGWVEQETRPNSFDLLLTLPQYTIELLDVIQIITSQDTQAYKNYAFGTYSSLKTLMDDDAADYRLAAFMSALENCQNLMTALKSLLNNIRRYHRLLGEQISANDILEGHFEGYQVLVNEKIFHPMVTRDSVLRFRQPVIGMISQIMQQDDLLQQIADQAVNDKRYQDTDTALAALLPQLQEMGDLFDSVDEIMTEIQLKNQSYTKASTDKLIYLLNQDRSVKEQLAKLIMNFRNLDQSARQDLAQNIAVFKQFYLDEQSIYARSSRKIRSQEAPVKTKPVDADDADLTGFVKSTSSRYSHARVMQFVHACFGQADVFDSRDLNLQQDEQFVMLLLAALKDGDIGLFYQVEYLKDTVSYGRYTCPHMRFVKKALSFDKISTE